MNEKNRTDYKRAFNEKAYDRLSITVPKGRKRAIEARVAEEGKSVNGVVNELLQGYMGLTKDEWREPDHERH